MDTQNLPHGGKTKVGEQATEPGFGGPQIKVVGQRHASWQRNARMLGIDFPWVKVEDGGLTLAIDPLEGPARNCVWIDPEISPPGDGHVTAQQAPSGHGEFQQGTPLTPGKVRPA